MKLNTLFGIAVGGLWACTGMIYLYINEASKRILACSLTQDALEILRQHKGAILYLGQPIKEIRADLINSSDITLRRDYKVAVMGPKSNGVLFFSVVLDKNNKFHLDTIELQIGKDDSKRLVIEKTIKLEEQ